ncbi:MAG TPA: TadE family type IV pilus minor pilin [Actinomycetales bacterium]|nr:TadE family type IV pilus minor pilin [Actinomycetales bacterium]
MADVDAATWRMALGRPPRSRQDVGTVTAELAVAMPAVTVLLAAVLSVGQAVLTQVACLDAARAGARAASRGDDPGAVRQVAAEAAHGSTDSDGTHVSVVRAGSHVTVTVSRPLRLLAFGPSVQVRAQAVAQSEQPREALG